MAVVARPMSTRLLFLNRKLFQMKHDVDSKSRLVVSTHDLTSNGGDFNNLDLEPVLDERIEDLKHRLRVEAAVVEGAKNVIKLLQNGTRERGENRKALQEVRFVWFFCKFFTKFNPSDDVLFVTFKCN